MEEAFFQHEGPFPDHRLDRLIAVLADRLAHTLANDAMRLSRSERDRAEPAEPAFDRHGGNRRDQLPRLAARRLVAAQEDHRNPHRSAVQRELGDLADRRPVKFVVFDGPAVLGVVEHAVAGAGHRVLADHHGHVVLVDHRVSPLARRGRPAVQELGLRMQILIADRAGPVAVQDQRVGHAFLEHAFNGRVDLRGQPALGLLVVFAGGHALLIGADDSRHAFQVRAHIDLHRRLLAAGYPRLNVHRSGKRKPSTQIRSFHLHQGVDYTLCLPGAIVFVHRDVEMPLGGGDGVFDLDPGLRAASIV